MSSTTDRLKAEFLAKQENLKYLRFLCERVFPFMPTDRQLDIWLRRFDVELVSYSIEAAGRWYVNYHQELEKSVSAGKMTQDEAFAKFKTEDDILRYASGCMYKEKAKREPK